MCAHVAHVRRSDLAVRGLELTVGVLDSVVAEEDGCVRCLRQYMPLMATKSPTHPWFVGWCLL